MWLPVEQGNKVRNHHRHHNIQTEHLSFKQTIFDPKMQFARAWLLFYMISLSANPQLLSAKRNFFLILSIFAIFGQFVFFYAVLQFLRPKTEKKREARDCCRSTKYCHAGPTGCALAWVARLTQQCQSLCTLLFKTGVNDPAPDLFEAVNLWVEELIVRYLNEGPTKEVPSLALKISEKVDEQLYVSNNCPSWQMWVCI